MSVIVVIVNTVRMINAKPIGSTSTCFWAAIMEKRFVKRRL